MPSKPLHKHKKLQVRARTSPKIIFLRGTKTYWKRNPPKTTKNGKTRVTRHFNWGWISRLIALDKKCKSTCQKSTQIHWKSSPARPWDPDKMRTFRKPGRGTSFFLPRFALNRNFWSAKREREWFLTHGYVQIQTFHQISNVSDLEMTSWSNFILILHNFSRWNQKAHIFKWKHVLYIKNWPG